MTTTAQGTFQQTRPHIRWMIRRDMPEVLRIEEASFAWDAWDENEFLAALRQADVIGMVAEVKDQVVGYMVYGLKKYHLDVVNFAVAPGHRRAGVGAAMVARLAGKLSAHRQTRITTTVAETNLAGQLFLRSQGFRATAVLRHHYQDRDEDAYRFVYQL